MNSKRIILDLDVQQKAIEALRWITGILNRHQIDYQISGGFAGKIFGSKRELHDIDIDIPERYFADIIPEISDYITYGPKRYKDEKWDLELITLNYKGQEIDLGGSDTLLVSNKEYTRWINSPNNFSKTLEAVINGVSVKVIHPTDLVAYKKELNGNHQLEDIEAAKQFLIKYDV